MVETSWISFSIPDPAHEYLALATFLPRKNYWSIISFFRQTGAIRVQLKESRGLVGYSMRTEIFGKRAWTVSVWEDETALNNFVRKVPHAETMKELQLGRARKFVRWTLPGSKVPPSWDDAFQRLKNRQS